MKQAKLQINLITAHPALLSERVESHASAVLTILRSVFLGVGLSLLTGAAVIAYDVVETEQRAFESVRVRGMERPVGLDLVGKLSAPTISQDSVEQAIQMFSIRVPRGVKTPQFDPSLTDRGLTTRKGALGRLNVTVGPDAFSSWALLASTIAHEVEVHCRQNFFAIHLMDMGGFDGTTKAEREAYMYELSNSKRFGLSQYDQTMIRNTMNYYYPKQKIQLTLPPVLKTALLNYETFSEQPDSY